VTDLSFAHHDVGTKYRSLAHPRGNLTQTEPIHRPCSRAATDRRPAIPATTTATRRWLLHQDAATWPTASGSPWAACCRFSQRPVGDLRPWRGRASFQVGASFSPCWTSDHSCRLTLRPQPWIFLIADGGRTDYWQAAAAKVKAGESANHFSFFSVGVEGARMDVLAQIRTREPLKLKELRFRDLFIWLSKSLGSVSKSAVGDKVELQNPAVWRARSTAPTNSTS
jgi:hypothetical protein